MERIYYIEYTKQKSKFMVTSWDSCKEIFSVSYDFEHLKKQETNKLPY